MMPLQAGPSWFGIPLIELWFVALFLTLAMFLWLDGTNFGMGVLYGLVDDHETKETILTALAPLWDGAEVWLVVFGGALFAVFPDVYGGLFSGYYLLMFAILGALIIRGVSPEFLEQREDAGWRRLWSSTFILGSTLAPFFLGMFAANWLVGASGIISVPGIVVGLALVAISTAQGAGFLGMKTAAGLDETVTRYGLLSQVAYLVLAVVTVGYLYVAVEGMAAKVVHPVVLALVAITAILGIAYLWLLRDGQYRPAFLAAGIQLFGLVALVAVLLFPVIYPVTGLTVFEAAVSTLQLKMMTVVLAIFLPLVLLYFAVLYSAFAGPVQAGEGY
ncbi:cytochrome d ubiquinol oxidase subunit II [Halodesulfurarchaeum formicicum]|nr:cytochrome d ubiquinol oxidase subunit II [Halodesulfurarchaeum formicicum]